LNLIYHSTVGQRLTLFWRLKSSNKVTDILWFYRTEWQGFALLWFYGTE